LIGTSIALALRECGTQVWLSDTDVGAARLAAELGAGQVLPPDGALARPADVAVLAVPPGAVASALAGAQQQRLAICYTDVASVKELPLREATAAGCDLAAFVPGHPMSGRERSGPAAARADLFAGQPWVICPAGESSEACVVAVTNLARACGAQPVLMSAAEHDQWVALVSHVPHLVASAMAAQCATLRLARARAGGPGLRDVTRIAASDTEPVDRDPCGETRRGRTRSSGRDRAARRGGRRAAALAEVTIMRPSGSWPYSETGREGVAQDSRQARRSGGSRLRRRAGRHRGLARRAGQAVRGGRSGASTSKMSGSEHSPGLPVGVAELSVRPKQPKPSRPRWPQWLAVASPA
jgi:prephenate dehydrogenase